MDFTREPIIQTVITPREGYRLVVRSSKTAGLEEHFVDAVEVVCFGTATFFRSIERPKPFIVPVSDYEVLEVREPRMVLKTPSESKMAEKPRAKAEPEKQKIQPEKQVDEQDASIERPKQAAVEPRGARRERRRGFRKRRGRDEVASEQAQAIEEQPNLESFEQSEEGKVLTTTPMLSTILPPPTKLIRDDLERLRESYGDAFFDIEKEEESEENVFPQESFGFSETDINMKEGGDAEVPQSDPFRENGGLFPEDAANAKKYDE